MVGGKGAGDGNHDVGESAVVAYDKRIVVDGAGRRSNGEGIAVQIDFALFGGVTVEEDVAGQHDFSRCSGRHRRLNGYRQLGSRIGDWDDRSGIDCRMNVGPRWSDRYHLMTLVEDDSCGGGADSNDDCGGGSHDPPASCLGGANLLGPHRGGCSAGQKF